MEWTYSHRNCSTLTSSFLRATESYNPSHKKTENNENIGKQKKEYQWVTHDDDGIPYGIRRIS